jgi:hypothetical protein
VLPEEFVLEAGAAKKRDLQLDVRIIRSGGPRYRHGDVVWLDFMASHRHLVVDVTATSARANTNDPRVGARLPLPGNLALGAQHSKLHADLRTSALLGTSSAQWVHDYYPFAMENGARLAPIAVEMDDRLAILVAYLRFLGMGDDDSRSLRYDIYARICNISFVLLIMFLFGIFGGMCGENSCNAFLLLFMVL